MSRARLATSVAVGACAIVLMPHNLFADEGGVSFWTPRSYDSLAAVTQVPGWSLSVTEYHDAVSAGGALSLARLIGIGQVPAGVIATINAHFSESTDLVSVAPTYVFATPVFGGAGVNRAIRLLWL